jgi:hypothetical protein
VNKIVIATLSHKAEEKLSFLPFSHGWQKFGEKESFKKKKKRIIFGSSLGPIQVNRAFKNSAQNCGFRK